MKNWDNKPYYSLDYYLKERFKEKVYKVTLDAGLTCPNRDGKIGTGGCIFCSAGGSGDFAGDSLDSITTQIEKQILLLKSKRPISKFIAYFQSFTNTYGDINYLRKVYYEAINHPDIVAISIATRPDCITKDVLELLNELNKIKPVWVELGLQTIDDKVADFIRRGYHLDVFNEAVYNLKKIGVEIIVHTIIGLPGEDYNSNLNTIKYLNNIGINGIKLQLLHILKYTDLAKHYENNEFKALEKDEYEEIVINLIMNISPDIVIHRITGDGPKDILIAPLWSSRKRDVLNSIHHKMKINNYYQGKYLD